MNLFSSILLFLAASESGLATANNGDKAGKSSEEVSLHRRRERLCDSMASFEGLFVYQSGCGGNPFEVSITCEDKGRKEEQRDGGLMCTFFEKTLNDDSGLCPSTGNFLSKEALSTDAKGNCRLGPISIHPVSMDGNKGCDENFPKLDVTIIPGDSKDELKIYFSNDGGKTYYNEEEPRIAVKIPDDDGKKSGGSSSKGGKKGLKGTNDRRKLVEKTLKQAQRKLACLGNAQLGQYCDKSSWSWNNWCAEDLYCHYNKCYKETKILLDKCGDEPIFVECVGKSDVKNWGQVSAPSERPFCDINKGHKCIGGECRPPGWPYYTSPYELC